VIDSFWKNQQFSTTEDYLKIIKSRSDLVEYYSYLKFSVLNKKNKRLSYSSIRLKL